MTPVRERFPCAALRRRWWCAATVLLAIASAPGQETAPAPASPPAVAEAADVVDDEMLLTRIEAACEQLRRDGALQTPAALLAAARDTGRNVPEVPRRAVALPPPELRAAVLASSLIVGHYYHCKECQAWHFTASSGFAVGADGIVATCHHLLADSEADAAEAGPELLVVADYAGRVSAVTAVLAADKDADVAVLRCTAKDLVPLPLGRDARAGDRIWCLSNPDHLFAYFSDGLVARRYVVRGAAPGTGTTPDAGGESPHRAAAPKGNGRVFLQVTCDFGTGSSGGAIVDAAGNLVGIAQSTTTILADPDAVPVETQMTARSAVPVAALRALLRR